MIAIKKEGILFSKTELEFENEGVLNPAVIRQDNSVYIYYRAVKKGNYSSIGFCKLDGPLTIAERWTKPLMVPEHNYESHGVEDARITKIDDLFYMTYTGYDGTNARGALATSKDLVNFEKQGIIVPSIVFTEFTSIVKKANNLDKRYIEIHPHNNINSSLLWDKNVVFFPRRINGNLVYLHRLRPGIQLVSFKNLNELTSEFWKEYLFNLHDHIVIEPVYKHESAYLGGGCPPIETEHGWVLIYHGVQNTNKGLRYSACAALLDLHNPIKELARLPYPLFKPELEWELNGEVNNVVFPTGTALFDETLYIYYGAADTVIACASVNFNDLVSELLTYTKK